MKKDSIKKIIEEIMFLIIPIYGICKVFSVDFNKYSGILLLILFVGIHRLYWKLRNEKNNYKLMILALIYSLFYVYGRIVDNTIMVSTDKIFGVNSLSNILSLYSVGVISYIGIKWIYYYLNNNKLSIDTKQHRIQYYIYIFVFFVIAYLPYFISFYPGIMTADSLVQLAQASGISSLSNHHPIAHTMVIKFFYFIGDLFGNTSIAVGLYSLFQLFASSAMFAYFIHFFDKNGCNKYLKWFIILFYSFVPTFGFYSVTMWKDILFGLFALFMTIQLYKFCFYKKLTKIDNIFVIFSVVLISLFRSNGLFVAILVSIVLIIFFKSKRIPVLKLFVLPTIACIIITGPIYSAFGITKTEFVETAGMPLRQLIGVSVTGVELDSKTNEFINNLMDADTIKENYLAFSFDSIKFHPDFNSEYLNTHKGEFIKSYLTSLIKQPTAFTEVYLKNTYGFWYIDADGNSAHYGPIEENQFNLYSDESKLKDMLINNYKYFENNPILKYTQRPSVYLCILLMFITFILVKKKYLYIIPCLVPFFVWLTIMIASPLSSQCRYVYALFTTFPLIIFMFSKLFYKENR